MLATLVHSKSFIPLDVTKLFSNRYVLLKLTEVVLSVLIDTNDSVWRNGLVLN